MTLRIAIIFMFAWLVVPFSTGCDKTDSFTIVNRASSSLVVETVILDPGGTEGESHFYTVPAGGSVDTRNERSIDGYKGGVLFSDRESLLICGYLNDSLTYEETFSHDDAGEKDFTFDVTTDSIHGDKCPKEPPDSEGQ